MRRIQAKQRVGILVLVVVILAGIQPPSPAAQPEAATYRVFAFNDLGMHCYDRNFSIFSILPLFNTLHAQVVRVGSAPRVLGGDVARLTYSAYADPSGSINTTSRGKTTFWTYLPGLFGITRPVDVGILGARMPGPDNKPRPFTVFEVDKGWFTARGIPITLEDDRGARNPYSLMSVRASSKATGSLLASLPVVVPASDEMACSDCHATGGDGAADPSITWSIDLNMERQYKKNILLLHDARMATGLSAAKPVLCAGCHYSPALDLAGTGPAGDQIGKPYLSRAVHGFHATRFPQDPSGITTCFGCHPGRQTQCLRGVMSAAGIGCVACHGTMSAVARDTRTPWADEPRCQSCHTGDVLANFDGQLIRRLAYADAGDTATPIAAANLRFAEQPGTLYRNSLGHGGMACEACHGSTHAEWPSRERNDNLAARSLQQHPGVIVECAVCHGEALGLSLNGPHGLHNISQSWVDGHPGFYLADASTCQACHGLAGEGTVLARTKAKRVFTVEDAQLRIYRGTIIGCGYCHDNPFLGGGAR